MLEIFTNASLGPRPACLSNKSTGGNENLWPLEAIMLLTLVTLTALRKAEDSQARWL